MQTSYSVVCTFLNQNNGVEKTCSITYGPVGGNCKTFKQTSQTLANDIVIVGLPLEEIEQEYCFSVRASNGSFTAIVEGTFKNGNLNNINFTLFINSIFQIQTSQLISQVHVWLL